MLLLSAVVGSTAMRIRHLVQARKRIQERQLRARLFLIRRVLDAAEARPPGEDDEGLAELYRKAHRTLKEMGREKAAFNGPVGALLALQTARSARLWMKCQGQIRDGHRREKRERARKLSEVRGKRVEAILLEAKEAGNKADELYFSGNLEDALKWYDEAGMILEEARKMAAWDLGLMHMDDVQQAILKNRRGILVCRNKMKQAALGRRDPRQPPNGGAQSKDPSRWDGGGGHRLK
jgi:hypothetical protein